jgi:hypothetical protein
MEPTTLGTPNAYPITQNSSLKDYFGAADALHRPIPTKSGLRRRHDSQLRGKGLRIPPHMPGVTQWRQKAESRNRWSDNSGFPVRRVYVVLVA